MAVYFIQEGDDGAVKIGTTVGSPMARLAALQTGNSKKLTLLASIPGGPKEETALHERFCSLRLHGEWFQSTPELLGFIDGLRYAIPQAMEPAHKEWNLFGLTADQATAIAGLVEALAVSRRVDEVLACASLSSGRQEGRVFGELYDVQSEVEAALAAATDPLNAYQSGLGAFGENVWRAKLAEVDEAIDKHNSAVAESLLAQDYHESVDVFDYGDAGGCADSARNSYTTLQHELN